MRGHCLAPLYAGIALCSGCALDHLAHGSPAFALALAGAGGGADLEGRQQE